MTVRLNESIVIGNADLNNQNLDAVLPLTLKDYDRFKILQRSLNLFCKELLGTLWIIVPDAQLAQIRQSIDSENCCVIPESELIPQIKWFPVQGWYLQQLIKIAIAPRIQTRFYLTLDADVICTKPIQYSDLVREGRAVYWAIDSKEYGNAYWYQWAWDVLKLQPPTQYRCHNVTPTILSTDAMIQLQCYLRQLSEEELANRPQLSGSKRKKFLSFASWLIYQALPKTSNLKAQLLDYRAYLIKSLPWTEYSLYYSFCEAKGLLEKYHIQDPDCICAGEQSIWHENEYENWHPEHCFKGERNFFFCVIQSNTQIPADAVWQKVEKFLL